MNIYTLLGWGIHVDISNKSVPLLELNYLMCDYHLVLKFQKNCLNIEAAVLAIPNVKEQ